VLVRARARKAIRTGDAWTMIITRGNASPVLISSSARARSKSEDRRPIEPRTSRVGVGSGAARRARRSACRRREKRGAGGWVLRQRWNRCRASVARACIDHHCAASQSPCLERGGPKGQEPDFPGGKCFCSSAPAYLWGRRSAT
jgi:hypothetical protein